MMIGVNLAAYENTAHDLVTGGKTRVRSFGPAFDCFIIVCHYACYEEFEEAGEFGEVRVEAVERSPSFE
jgi:hypothetical protein